MMERRENPLRSLLVRLTVPSIATAWLVVATACGDDRGPGNAAAGPIAHDSAGVRIVEVPASLLERIPRWTIDSVPELDIGVLEGEPEYQLSAAAYTTTLSDGSIVVRDWGSRSIRYYGPDGTFIPQVGRLGEGPGEFRAPYGIDLLPNDSVLVWDIQIRRVTVLTREGEVGRIGTIRQAGLNEQYVGALDDGTILLDWRWRSTRKEDNRHLLVRAGVDGEILDTLRVLPMEVEEIARLGRSEWAEEFLAPDPVQAAGDSTIWWSPGGPFEVHRLDPAGHLLAILRFEVARRTVTPDWLEWWIDSVIARSSGPPEQRASLRRFYDARGAADSFPSLQGIEIGTDGRVWLRRYHFPGERGAWDWLVVEPDGTPVAWVTVPPGFGAYEFGPDYLLGVGRDEYDVNHVQRFRLVELPPGDR